jgi:hypothetical protein
LINTQTQLNGFGNDRKNIGYFDLLGDKKESGTEVNSIYWSYYFSFALFLKHDLFPIARYENLVIFVSNAKT